MCHRNLVYLNEIDEQLVPNFFKLYFQGSHSQITNRAELRNRSHRSCPRYLW